MKENWVKIPTPSWWNSEASLKLKETHQCTKNGIII